MDFLNAYTFGFCEKRGFTKGSAWKELLETEFVRERVSEAVTKSSSGQNDRRELTFIEENRGG